MNSITAERWSQLRSVPANGGIAAEQVDPDIPGCLMGVEEDGSLHFLIAVGEEPREIPQELEAVVVRVVQRDRLYLDVLSRSHYEMIFTPLVNQIFYGVAVQGRKPIDAVADAIAEFRGALKPLKPAMTLAEQIGLVGELWVLRNVLIPEIGARACRLWSGPYAERHDFIGERAHIEVKSTTRSEDRHEISRLDQLRAPDDKRLLLASVQLERTDAGEMTLATLIDAVVGELGADGHAIGEFQLRLAAAQWHDGLRQSSELHRFRVRDAQFFEVEGSFPRMPDDYVPPRGIVSIRYTIDLSARSVLDAGTVNTIVRTM
ncbi:MAG: PD-(D/E)XK motif protein [Betaproteobacteria bacterium]|nr:PD-(D/E)XK motif protein [Betaproteobacteria bacterium]MDE2151779.1 PD-(D/E)XK motif protein [Betaproteobacteria bacterium]